MNATDRARRSDSLYFDTTVTNRRALCDMIANLESDLEDIKAEKERLRSDYDKLRKAAARVLSTMIVVMCMAGGSEQCKKCSMINEGACVVADAAKCCIGIKVES